MPRINGSVGRGGKNESQDVAVIQLGLYHIEIRTGSGRKRLYEGMIDGIPSPELFKAISAFQQCVGEPVTGRIQPFTPILSKINRMGLPVSLIGMEGVKGTAAVYVPDSAPSEIETLARSETTRVELKAPLPKKLAASLSQVIRRINMKTRLYLVLKEVCITPRGRFEARLRFEMASFVSPLTRRLILIEPDYTPPEVIALVCQQVEDAQGWNAGSDDNLVFTSTATYSSLTNRKEPSQAELKSIGLSQCPSDKLLKACVQGCIALGNSGALNTPNGKAEHADLIRVVLNIDATLAKNLQATGAASPGHVMEDVAKFIHSEMLANISSREASQIRRHNENFPSMKPDFGVGDKLAAYALWASKVASGQDWDFKTKSQKIVNPDGTGWIYDPVTQTQFNEDIWGNIHYGFVGRAVEFSRDELLSGGGFAQIKTIFDRKKQGSNNELNEAIARAKKAAPGDILKSIDDPVDSVAVTFGMDLWESYGKGLASTTFLDQLRASAPQLNTRKP